MNVGGVSVATAGVAAPRRARGFAAEGAGWASAASLFVLRAVLAGFLPRTRREPGRLAGAESSLAAAGLDVSSSDLGGTIECGLRAGRSLFQEAISQRIDLFSQKFGRSVVKENVVCQLAFSGQWQLLG